MISVGQIYKDIHNNKKYVITFVGIGYTNKKQVHYIDQNGYTYTCSVMRFEKYGGTLLNQYSSFMNALNSDEFNRK